MRTESCSLTVTFYLILRFFHLLEKFRIANDPGGVSDFPTRLVQPSYNPDDSTFRNISKCGDLLKGLDRPSRSI